MDVRLRKVRFTDAPYIVAWRNANKEFFTTQADFTLASHGHWFWETYMMDPADHFYMVLADGEGVGTIGFNSRTREVGRVLLGDKRCERRGVMTEALRQLMQAFGPGRYWLRALRGNRTAIRFYRRNGFSVYYEDDDWDYMEASV